MELQRIVDTCINSNIKSLDVGSNYCHIDLGPSNYHNNNEKVKIDKSMLNVED